MADPEFGEEFDTVVDELTDQYIQNELHGEERERVEEYFLNATERQHKLQFASQLLRHAAETRGQQQPPVARVKESGPSLWEQFAAFWRTSPYAAPVASLAAVVLVAGLFYYTIRLSDPGATEYAQLNLTISTADRAAGPSSQQVKLPDYGLDLHLAIPEQAKDATDYRVKLIGSDGYVRDLKIRQVKDQVVTVTVPAAWLVRGSYAIQLSMVKPDGREERVRGSYYFDLE